MLLQFPYALCLYSISQNKHRITIRKESVYAEEDELYEIVMMLADRVEKLAYENLIMSEDMVTHGLERKVG